MNYKINDYVVMKKNHACGTNVFSIIRIGMEIKLRCCEDNKIIILKRKDFEKNIKAIKQ